MVQQPGLAVSIRSQVVCVGATKRLGDLLLVKDCINWVAIPRHRRAHRRLHEQEQQGRVATYR